MDDYEEYEEGGRSKKWLLFILIPIVVAALVAGGIWAGKTFFSDGKEGESGHKSALEAAMAGERIGYASNVVTSDPVTLQQTMDEMYERVKQPGLSVDYKNMAFSEDGQTFECYIGNSARNKADLFIAIYADPEMTDLLFLSELLRPGSRFEEITLERKLEPGEHKAYLVHTRVKENEEDGAMLQTIDAQIATTITLVVTEP